MKYIISKDKQVKCTTTVPYSAEILRRMKEAGYEIEKVKEKRK